MGQEQLPATDRQRLDAIVEQFEQAWGQDDQRSIEELLPEDEPLRTAMLIELVHVDLEHQLKAGQTARVEDYLERFPSLKEDTSALQELVQAEFELRVREEPELTPDRYGKRFPQLAPPRIPRGGIHTRCPHCHNPIELVDDSSIKDIDCPSCGSSFNLASLETIMIREGANSEPAPFAFLGIADTNHFGDHELLEEIARGGMGIVYKARQISVDRTVALKVILAGELASKEEVQRFKIEAEAAATLDHPGIVPIYQVGEQNGQHYFTMRFIEGESLAHRVVDGPLSSTDAAELTKQIAEAISHAHAKGVIHRDLKPTNVLLDQTGHPHVTDFGLAKKINADSSLTGTGQVLGTPSYMSPEQAAGRSEDVGPLSDVYSLGAILYCLLTGRPPFQAASQMATIIQVIEQEPAPPRLLNPTIDHDLETICLTCLEKEPQHRYSSAQELVDDLARYIEGDPIKVRSLNILERVSRTLQRSKYDVELRTWARILFYFAGIVGFSEVGIYLHAIDGPPYPTMWAVLIRLSQFTLMGLVLWRYRREWSIMHTVAERQMWSIWTGYVIACIMVVLVAREMSSDKYPLDELRVYPTISVISGLIFYIMGSSYWGKCYIFAMAFFLVAIAMPLSLKSAPLGFGVLWAISLISIGKHLQKLAT